MIAQKAGIPFEKCIFVVVPRYCLRIVTAKEEASREIKAAAAPHVRVPPSRHIPLYYPSSRGTIDPAVPSSAGRDGTEIALQKFAVIIVEKHEVKQIPLV